MAIHRSLIAGVCSMLLACRAEREEPVELAFFDFDRLEEAQSFAEERQASTARQAPASSSPPGTAQRAPAGGSAPAANGQNAALSCFQRARDQTLLGEGNAFLLCRGASSTAPAECYERADDQTHLSRRELFDLCRCARSTEPVNCFQRAERDTFLENRQIIQLCSPIVTLNLWPSCTPAVP
jgi:hypothetical protein